MDYGEHDARPSAGQQRKTQRESSPRRGRMAWEEGSAPRTVAVLRALDGLGDLLCIVPFLRSLRAALPESHISLVGLPEAREFVARFARYVDELIEFPGYPGLPEREPLLDRIPGFLGAMQARRFDLAIQLQGNGIQTNHVVTLFGARRTAGLFLTGQFRPDGLFYPYPFEGHEIRRLLALASGLGLPDTGDDLDFPLGSDDERALAELCELVGVELSELVVVHAGAKAASRRCPPGLLAEVAEGIAASGLGVAVTGTDEERGVTAALLGSMRTRALDLTGRTTTGALGSLLRRARLLVCNDTGVSHLAAALGTPSVVLFTGSDPDRWAPLDARRHVAVGRPFSDREGGRSRWGAHAHCLGDGCLYAPGAGQREPIVTFAVADVLAAARRLLEETRGDGVHGSA